MKTNFYVTLFLCGIWLCSFPSDLKAQSSSQTVLAPNPAAASCTAPTVTFSVSNADSYNKDAGASASICLTRNADNFQKGISAPPLTLKSFYFFDASATYDDKWKDGKAALSTVTQQYSGMLGSLGRIGFAPTTILLGYYHSNTQGIILEQGYGVGFWMHFQHSAAIKLPKNSQDLPSSTTANPPARTLLLSATARGEFDQLYGSAGDVNRVGVGFYSAFVNPLTAKASLSGSFKGFLPAASPLVFGSAFAEIDYQYKFTEKWAATLSVVDSYYATVPANFRPNSLDSKIGLSYKIGGS